MDLPVPIPTIDMAVAMRDLSVYKDLRMKADQLYKPKVGTLEVTEELLTDLENGLAFCMVMAYAQGLSMLAKASVEHQMNIPLPDVVKVWRAGCIIRSTLLGNFAEAYQRNATLENILLDSEMAELVKNREQSLRNILTAGIEARIPLAGISSALGYYDALLSGRMATNLIQAQRDFFGAHTYQRLDKKGVFHTEWHLETNE
jgi:6-phosphogluconate dehydrogenase